LVLARAGNLARSQPHTESIGYRPPSPEMWSFSMLVNKTFRESLSAPGKAAGRHLPLHQETLEKNRRNRQMLGFPVTKVAALGAKIGGKIRSGVELGVLGT
jgi:hypothetical protein